MNSKAGGKKALRARPEDGVAATRARAEHPSWTFLTNHAHVLICVSREGDLRLREIAELVGITERAAHRIVNDLTEGGYLMRERVGRRNHYRVNPDLPLRHPLESDRSVGALLALFKKGAR